MAEIQPFRYLKALSQRHDDRSKQTQGTKGTESMAAVNF